VFLFFNGTHNLNIAITAAHPRFITAYDEMVDDFTKGLACLFTNACVPGS
jgi:hypothetical protein